MTVPQDQNLLQAMGSPDFYPHDTTPAIALEQTHVSYVFLTGDFAYKVKKAVNFGFLDFSTLAKRKQFCEAELAMNQGVAPDIYLEVVAFTQEGDRYGINGPGPVVEYGVKMRQFPQSQLLSAMFDRGELTETHLAQLGEVVAAFHQTTLTNEEINGFGTVAQIRQSIDENYAQTQGYIGTVQTQQQYDETKAFSDRFFAEHAQIFAERQNQGKIRECHGDLHLRNLCFWQGKLQLFDRIEFNKPFRYVDVMYDVAFAVMDLEARGRRDLGNVFLNRYLETTGDWEGLQVLPLYLSRQAYVRAKVTSFLLNDPHVPESDKEQARRTAADYYRLAWQYTQRSEGQIWMMSGLSGSGKSTLGQAIAQRENAIHLRSDAIRKQLGGIGLQEKGPDDLYSPEMTARTYRRLLELGQCLVAQGFQVILDGKYDRHALREPVIQWCQGQGIPLKIVHCHAEPDVLKARLSDRQGDISDATAALIDDQLRQWEGFTPEEQPFVVAAPTLTAS